MSTKDQSRQSASVGEQIRHRMEALNVSVQELAKRVGVSDQSVYHWKAGRNMPNKHKAAAVEKALNFRIDFTGASAPGVAPSPMPPAVQSSGHSARQDGVRRSDVEILLAISRLPDGVKACIGQLAEAIAEMYEDLARDHDGSASQGSARRSNRA